MDWAPTRYADRSARRGHGLDRNDDQEAADSCRIGPKIAPSACIGIVTAPTADASQKSANAGLGLISVKVSSVSHPNVADQLQTGHKTQ
jgi:hypothetical protein